MLLWLVLLAELMGAPSVKDYSVTTKGVSTIFGYAGDKYGSGRTRCLRDEYGNKRPVNPEKDIGIAHRDLACGAVVYITNLETGMTLRTVVIDAGPWGATSKDPTTGKPFWYVKKNAWHRPGKLKCPSRECAVGKWRGIADLTPKAAELLDHDGWAPIKLTYDKRDLRSYRRLQKAKQRQEEQRNQT